MTTASRRSPRAGFDPNRLNPGVQRMIRGHGFCGEWHEPTDTAGARQIAGSYCTLTSGHTTDHESVDMNADGDTITYRWPNQPEETTT